MCVVNWILPSDLPPQLRLNFEPLHVRTEKKNHMPPIFLRMGNNMLPIGNGGNDIGYLKLKI
jgi:hypothetical protein